MKKLTKEQQALLECALDRLYSFLKRKYNVYYCGKHIIKVYEDIIRLNQYSYQKGVAWSAEIELKDRKIYLITREAKYNTVYSKYEYDLFYMSSVPVIHHLDF